MSNVTVMTLCHKPTPSMYGIFTYIYHKNPLNVGKYTIHGSYGKWGEMNLPLTITGLTNKTGFTEVRTASKISTGEFAGFRTNHQPI